ncbi:MAG: tol-pal system-associated acyl-CoA thioesterase [Aestuariivirga sp.]
MSDRWPDAAGRITGDVHVLPVRVYYEDTDFSGVVYHANYLKFCERARSDCLRLRGIHHARLEGMAFAVRRMVCEFLKPARIDDLLEVETRFLELAGARIEIEQVVKRAGDRLFSVRVTVALVDKEGRPKRLPKAMGAALNFHPESEL